MRTFQDAIVGYVPFHNIKHDMRHDRLRDLGERKRRVVDSFPWPPEFSLQHFRDFIENGLRYLKGDRGFLGELEQARRRASEVQCRDKHVAIGSNPNHLPPSLFAVGMDGVNDLLFREAVRKALRSFLLAVFHQLIKRSFPLTVKADHD